MTRLFSPTVTPLGTAFIHTKALPRCGCRVCRSSSDSAHGSNEVIVGACDD